MNTLLRACDLFTQTLPEGAPPLTDSEIFVVCDVCGDLSLSSLYLTLKRDVVYTCPTTFKPILIMSQHADWKGTYKVGDYSIWHDGELHFRGTRIPRPQLALREIRARATKQRRKKRA